MDFKVFLRRLTSLFLCFVLAVCSPVLPVAYAAEPATATLAISAGAMASGGIGGGGAALSVIAPQVAVAVGVALAASGVNVYLTDASKAQGMTKTQFVQQKLYQWCDAMGNSASYVLNGIANDITVLENGTIQMGETAGKAISQFGEWLFQSGDVVQDVVGGPTDTITLGGIGQTVYGTSLTVSQRNYYNTSKSVAFVGLASSASATTAKVYMIALEEFTATMHYGSAGTTRTATNYNDTGYYTTSFTQSYSEDINTLRQLGVLIYVGANIGVLISNLTGYNPDAAVPGQDCFTGDAADWAENKDVLNPGMDEAISLNPDVLNKVLDAIAGASDYTMDISSYFDAIAQAFDGVQDFAADVTDTLTGIQEQVTGITDALANPTIAISTPADGFPAFDPSEINMDGTISALQFDLTNIFPFCIPFDIAAAIDMLDATPQAPSYHVHWVLPGNILFDFDVNLQQFDSTAALLRKMELLLFIVGLAVATRSMFIRG